MEISCFFTMFATYVLLKSRTLCLGKTVHNSTTDQDALLAFKNNISPDSYGILADNWLSTNTNTSVCHWIGVSCGIKHNQRVTSLNLSGFSLRGAIAPHLGNLTFLQSLDFSSNNFTGILPNELSKLHRLKLLNVGSNFLSGNVPQEFGNFSYLETLNLEYNQFTGFMPYGIFNMSSMIEISLRGCSLSGTLPSDICDNTPKLKILNVRANQLYGEIPPNIYKCSKLEDLRLSFNRFEGNIPTEIGSLINLQALSLANNSFGGGIPKQLGNLTSLNYLHLYGNKLTGELPQELSNLAYLEQFSVSNNNLSGSIPSFMFNISTLKLMSLSSNHFSGALPSAIGMGLSLLSLERLYLSDNELMGEIPSYITNATKLILLQISKNSFSGHAPDFGNLRSLQTFRIWENNLTGDVGGILSSLTNCRNLQELDISINPLNGILPTSIGNFSTSLQRFVANKCNIVGAIPSDIGNLTSLLLLSLSSNKLTFIPTTLGKLNHLQDIELFDNRLQGYIPPELCKMSNLGSLIFNDNMFTGAIPECFGELTSLRQVHLNSNYLNSTIPSNFWNLVDLLVLNLSSNYLSGRIPSEIASLKVIYIIDLSRNQFSGEIPSLIGSSQTIEFLSLAHNKFQGSIPISLGNVINLKSLDLSSNKLVGVIPMSLQGLHYLQNFNVSYNKLEGEIPTGGPFVNFTSESFLQNSGLCGESRFHVQLCHQTYTRARLKNVSVLLVKYILPPVITTIILIIIMLLLIKRKIKQNKVLQMVDISLGIIVWRRISYQELVTGTSAFSETNLLGRGGFGSVFKGTLSDGLNVAVKVFNLQLEGASKSFDTECEILGSVRHRNLVPIIGCCCNTEIKSVILAYMPNGSLEKWLYSESDCLDMLQRLNIAIDVALALEYLHHGHTLSVVHCDLKPSNILLDEDMTAHVADFGISKLFDEGQVVTQTTTLATIGYTAPEYGSEGKVSTSGDVYSYGILLLEMFAGMKPTDDMFSEEMSLKDWVSEALLLQEITVHDIVAPGLLTSEDRRLSAKEDACVSSVFGLAMQCLAFSPEERVNTRHVVATLQKIKAKILERQ